MLWITSVLTKVLVSHGLIILWWVCQAYSRLVMLVHPLGNGAVHASPALVRGLERQGAHAHHGGVLHVAGEGGLDERIYGINGLVQLVNKCRVDFIPSGHPRGGWVKG